MHSHRIVVSDKCQAFCAASACIEGSSKYGEMFLTLNKLQARWNDGQTVVLIPIPVLSVTSSASVYKARMRTQCRKKDIFFFLVYYIYVVLTVKVTCRNQ